MESGKSFLPALVKITGLGRALPSRVVTADEVDALCGNTPGWTAARTGVLERRWAGPDENAISLGVAAAREALDEAGVSPNEIGLVLNASGTPFQSIPDNAAFYLKELGLGDSGIPGFSIHATCLSFLPALNIAARFLCNGDCQHVLIISSDVASPGLSFENPESAALMGDAASAVVISRGNASDSSQIEAFHMETYGDGAEHSGIRGGGSRIHANTPESDPRNFLFDMNGKALLKAISRRLPPFLERLRPGLSRGVADLDYIIPHQASGLGLTMLRKYHWPETQIIRTLDFLGNCIAASIPSTLYEGVKNGPIEPGDRILLVGTGAGVSIAGVILTL